MKKAFLPLLMAFGCATAVTEEDDTTPTPTKKDSGTIMMPDAGQMMMTMDAADEDVAMVVDTGTTCSLTIMYGTPMCDTCMQSFCCKQDNACTANKDCTDLLTCLNACLMGDANPSQCLNACMNQHPQGAQLFNAIGNCVQSSCGNQCR